MRCLSDKCWFASSLLFPSSAKLEALLSKTSGSVPYQVLGIGDPACLHLPLRLSPPGREILGAL